MATLTQVRRKLNDFFFGDEPDWTDEMWFYGVMALATLITCFVAASVY